MRNYNMDNQPKRVVVEKIVDNVRYDEEYELKDGYYEARIKSAHLNKPVTTFSKGVLPITQVLDMISTYSNDPGFSKLCFNSSNSIAFTNIFPKV